jgi:hypothetical protein
MGEVGDSYYCLMPGAQVYTMIIRIEYSFFSGAALLFINHMMG